MVGARLQRKNLYALSAVSPHDGGMDSLVLLGVDARMMSMFRDEAAQRHADELVFMVLERAGWHIAGELAVASNIRLMFLPPHSPELNPAEHLWEAMREHCFANHVFSDLDAVERVLTTSIVPLETDRVRSRSMPGFN